MQSIKLLLALFSAVLLVTGNAALAQQFAGQTVTMIVNYPAGGPADIEARIVAKHLPKHVQGVSTVVVRNVGGAAGRIGVNQLAEASEKDRLNISFITWDPVDQILQEKTLHVRYQDLKFIAGSQMTTLLFMRRDTPPGITKPADVATARLFRAGGLAPNSHGTLRQRLALELLGANFETIAGYKGLRDIEVAVRQGDIQLTHTSLPSWFTSVKPNLVDTGIVMPVLQYDYVGPDGSLGRSPNLPDVPAFHEVYKQVWGKDATPSGEKWETLSLLTRVLDSVFRTVFMPPNAPAAAVAEMRAAFARLAKDADYIADYERVVKAKPRFIVGPEGERIIAKLGQVPPAIVTFLRDYIKAAQ